MDRRNNPFAPGAGLQPPELAGRDRLIEDVTIDMDRVLSRRPTKGVVLLGLRGVGKPCCSIDCARSLRQAGGRHLRRAVSILRGFANAFKVKIGDIECSVEPAHGAGDSSNLEQDLPHVLMAVAEAAAVVVACHEIAQRNLPVFSSVRDYHRSRTCR